MSSADEENMDMGWLTEYGGKVVGGGTQRQPHTAGDRRSGSKAVYFDCGVGAVAKDCGV